MAVTANKRDGFVFALVDVDVFEQASSAMWGRHRGYARTADRIFLHHLVMGVPSDGLEIDHANRDPLDNRRENLRAVTHAQNVQNRSTQKNNTSGFKGVHRVGSRWRAGIGNQKLGCFASAEDAAKAYDRAARKLYGEYAIINFAV